jgi:hypothetical protein
VFNTLLQFFLFSHFYPLIIVEVEVGKGGSNFEAKPSQSQPQGADLLAASRHSTLLFFFTTLEN